MPLNTEEDEIVHLLEKINAPATLTEICDGLKNDHSKVEPALLSLIGSDIVGSQKYEVSGHPPVILYWLTSLIETPYIENKDKEKQVLLSTNKDPPSSKPKTNHLATMSNELKSRLSRRRPANAPSKTSTTTTTPTTITATSTTTTQTETSEKGHTKESDAEEADEANESDDRSVKAGTIAKRTSLPAAGASPKKKMTKKGFVPPLVSLETKLEKEAQRLEKELQDKKSKLEQFKKDGFDEAKFKEKVSKAVAEQAELDTLILKWKAVVQPALSMLHEKITKRQEDMGQDRMTMTELMTMFYVDPKMFPYDEYEQSWVNP